MNRGAIYHRNTEEYIYPVSRKKLVVKLQVGLGDIRECRLIYFSRTSPENKKEARMEKNLSDNYFDYYTGYIENTEVARYQKYYFKLWDLKGDILYLGSNGLVEEEPWDFFEYLYTNPGDAIQIPDWARGTIYYQIFPERFANGDTSNDPVNTKMWGSEPTRDNFMGGDIAGIHQKIPYLKDLGIETIYLNPIFYGDFNHKYATRNYYEIDPIFGTNEEFRELVENLHRNHIRIVLDGVFNHTGIEFEPFKDFLEKGAASEYYNWFLTNKKTGISVSHRDYECVGAYKYMPKLNTSNGEVRKFIINVMDFWIREYGIDGWRLDVADEIDMAVWQEANMVLKGKYPDIILIGETWGYGGRLVNGKKLDSVMNYMFRDAVRDYYGYEKIDEKEFHHRINRMLWMYKEETASILYNLIDSHDTERFLYYCKGDASRLKLAVAFQMLFIGSPAIYYGDEVGMTGENDPDCRKCMVWDEEQDKDLLDWYKKLIQLRKNNKALRIGHFSTLCADKKEQIFAFRRWWEEEEITVIIRKARGRGDAYVECKGGVELLTGNLIEGGQGKKIAMEPYSVKVIKH